MRRKKVNARKIHKFMKGNVIVPILFIVVAFGVLLTSGTLYNKSATDSKEEYGQAQTEGGTGKQNIQLKNVSFQPKPSPSTDSCNHDMSKKADPDKCQCVAWLIKCEGGSCKDIDYTKSGIPSGMSCTQVDQSNWCQIFGQDGDGWYCIGKPVIYLYPKKPTLVDVSVETEGDIVISDPHYPPGGWRQVLANPNGTLEYQNKQYRELFYETQSRALKRPESGVIMEKQNLKSQLLDFITKLGLSRKDEQQEFLEWWIPRLQAIKTDRLFVSILERNEKERIDKVNISPKPDTMIEFIVYFAPLADGETVAPLILPRTPKRIGFTAIEWGGVIGR